jgi:hypothetical protein
MFLNIDACGTTLKIYESPVYVLAMILLTNIELTRKKHDRWKDSSTYNDAELVINKKVF